MTEPGAETDVLGMSTVAVRDGENYILNGSKTYITNGYEADVFQVYAKVSLCLCCPTYISHDDMAGGRQGQRIRCREGLPRLLVRQAHQQVRDAGLFHGGVVL